MDVEQKPNENVELKPKENVEQKSKGDEQQLASDTSALMLELEGRLNAKLESFKKELLSQKVEKKEPKQKTEIIEEEW